MCWAVKCGILIGRLDVGDLCGVVFSGVLIVYFVFCD